MSLGAFLQGLAETGAAGSLGHHIGRAKGWGRPQHLWEDPEFLQGYQTVAELSWLQEQWLEHYLPQIDPQLEIDLSEIGVDAAHQLFFPPEEQDLVSLLQSLSGIGFDIDPSVAMPYIQKQHPGLPEGLFLEEDITYRGPIFRDMTFEEALEFSRGHDALETALPEHYPEQFAALEGLGVEDFFAPTPKTPDQLYREGYLHRDDVDLDADYKDGILWVESTEHPGWVIDVERPEPIEDETFEEWYHRLTPEIRTGLNLHPFKVVEVFDEPARDVNISSLEREPIPVSLYEAAQLYDEERNVREPEDAFNMVKELYELEGRPFPHTLEDLEEGRLAPPSWHGMNEGQITRLILSLAEEGRNWEPLVRIYEDTFGVPFDTAPLPTLEVPEEEDFKEYLSLVRDLQIMVGEGLEGATAEAAIRELAEQFPEHTAKMQISVDDMRTSGVEATIADILFGTLGKDSYKDDPEVFYPLTGERRAEAPTYPEWVKDRVNIIKETWPGHFSPRLEQLVDALTEPEMTTDELEIQATLDELRRREVEPETGPDPTEPTQEGLSIMGFEVIPEPEDIPDEEDITPIPPEEEQPLDDMDVDGFEVAENYIAYISRELNVTPEEILFYLADAPDEIIDAWTEEIELFGTSTEEVINILESILSPNDEVIAPMAPSPDATEPITDDLPSVTADPDTIHPEEIPIPDIDLVDKGKKEVQEIDPFTVEQPEDMELAETRDLTDVVLENIIITFEALTNTLDTDTIPRSLLVSEIIQRKHRGDPEYQDIPYNTEHDLDRVVREFFGDIDSIHIEDIEQIIELVGG